jgi:hypothetical protein
MKIVLREQASGSYFLAGNTWTNNADHARGFESTWQAVQFWEEHRLPPTTIVMKAEDPRYDVAVVDCPWPS